MNWNLFSLVILILLSACQTDEDDHTVAGKEKSVKPLVIPILPDEMIFCGQKVNLQDEDIRERLDREILVNAYYQSATLQALKRANRFFPIIEPILKENGIPDDFKYLAVIESNLVQAVSPAGAQGFWQFMPVTAKEQGLIMNGEIDERLNIEKSTAAACEYLNFSHEMLKDWVLAAASYNRGVGGVRSDMQWQGTSNYFDTQMNPETGRYVYRILAVKLIFEDPEAYGYDLKHTELYEPFKTTSVTVRSSIYDLAEWSLQNGINYKILIKLNPWILGNKLTVKGTPLKIKLPQRTFNLKPYEAYQ
ncbi:MAG: lytic transglycosylase domain-containing protein [Flavobacteriia bacterium]